MLYVLFNSQNALDAPPFEVTMVLFETIMYMVNHPLYCCSGVEPKPFREILERCFEGNKEKVKGEIFSGKTNPRKKKCISEVICSVE